MMRSALARQDMVMRSLRSMADAISSPSTVFA